MSKNGEHQYSRLNESEGRVDSLQPGLDVDRFNALRQRYARIGTCLTAASMIGQSIFGMLLIDRKLMKESDLTARIAVDLLMLVTAFEGKRRLVQYFSQDNFKNIADNDFFSKVCRSMCTPSGVVNTLFTVNASFVFAGLSNLGFDGAAFLLLEFDTDFTESLHDVLCSMWVKLPIAAAAFVCNLFSFPQIHQGACAMLARLGSKLSTLCQSKEETVKETGAVEKVIRLKKYLIDLGVRQVSLYGGKSAVFNGFLNSLPLDNYQGSESPLCDTIIRLDTNGTNTSLASNAMKYYSANETEICGGIINDPYRKVSAVETGSRLVGKLIGFITTGYGFYNFKNMPAAILHDKDGVTEVLGWSMFASMMCISLLTVPPAVDQILNLCWPRSSGLPMLSPCAEKSVLVGAFLFCFIGASPNAYQAAVLDPEKEPLEFVVAAFLAPVLVELFTFVTLLMQDILQCSSRSEDQEALHERFDSLFDKIIEGCQAAEGEVDSDSASVTPERNDFSMA